MNYEARNKPRGMSEEARKRARLALKREQMRKEKIKDTLLTILGVGVVSSSVSTSLFGHEYYGSISVFFKNIFDDNGEFKNVYDLYLNINDDNKKFVDNVILSFILTQKIELANYMSDLKFRDYLSDIIADYNNKILAFYRNFDRINYTFTDHNEHNSYLEYNFNILKANVIVLTNYIDEYDLEIKSGMILDNRRVPNVLRKRVK